MCHMDVQKWLSETAAADPRPSPRGKRKRRHKQPDNHRKQVASEHSEALESAGSVSHAVEGRPRKRHQHERAGPRDDRAKASVPMTATPAAPSEPRKGGSPYSELLTSGAVEDGSSDRSCSVSATVISQDLALARPEERYERRARHKTRPDRYELKDSKQSRSRKPKTDAARPRKPRGNIARRGKTSEALVHSFAASNVAQDRLTLRQAGPGLFTKGRTSLPYRRKGLPDLTFSRIIFRQPKHRNSELRDTERSKESRRRRDRALDKDEGISRFFSTTALGHSGREHALGQAKRRQASVLYNTRRELPSSTPAVEDPAAAQFLGFGRPGPGSGTAANESILRTSLTRSISWTPTSQAEDLESDIGSGSDQSPRHEARKSIDKPPSDGSQASSANRSSSPTAKSTNKREKLSKPKRSNGVRGKTAAAQPADHKQAPPSPALRRGNGEMRRRRPEKPQAATPTFNEDLRNFFDRWKDTIQDKGGFGDAFGDQSPGAASSQNGARPEPHQDPISDATNDRAAHVDPGIDASSQAQDIQSKREMDEIDSVSHDSNASSGGPLMHGALGDSTHLPEHDESPPGFHPPDRDRTRNVGAAPLIHGYSLHYADKLPLYGSKPLYQGQMPPADDRVSRVRRQRHLPGRRLVDVATGAEARSPGHWMGPMTRDRLSDMRAADALNNVVTAFDVDGEQGRSPVQRYQRQVYEQQASRSGLKPFRSPMHDNLASARDPPVLPRNTTSELEYLQESMVGSEDWEPDLRKAVSLERAEGSLDGPADAMATRQDVRAEGPPDGFWQPNILY